MSLFLACVLCVFIAIYAAPLTNHITLQITGPDIHSRSKIISATANQYPVEDDSKDRNHVHFKDRVNSKDQFMYQKGKTSAKTHNEDLTEALAHKLKELMTLLNAVFWEELNSSPMDRKSPSDSEQKRNAQTKVFRWGKRASKVEKKPRKNNQAQGQDEGQSQGQLDTEKRRRTAFLQRWRKMESSKVFRWGK